MASPPEILSPPPALFHDDYLRRVTLALGELRDYFRRTHELLDPVVRVTAPQVPHWTDRTVGLPELVRAGTLVSQLSPSESSDSSDGVVMSVREREDMFESLREQARQLNGVGTGAGGDRLAAIASVSQRDFAHQAPPTVPNTGDHNPGTTSMGEQQPAGQAADSVPSPHTHDPRDGMNATLSAGNRSSAPTQAEIPRGTPSASATLPHHPSQQPSSPSRPSPAGIMRSSEIERELRATTPDSLRATMAEIYAMCQDSRVCNTLLAERVRARVAVLREKYQENLRAPGSSTTTNNNPAMSTAAPASHQPSIAPPGLQFGQAPYIEPASTQHRSPRVQQRVEQWQRRNQAKGPSPLRHQVVAQPPVVFAPAAADTTSATTVGQQAGPSGRRDTGVGEEILEEVKALEIGEEAIPDGERV